MTTEPGRFEIAGVKVDAVTLRQTVDQIDAWIKAGQREYIVVIGAHGIVEMQADPDLRAINERAGLTTPDGMPVVWLGRAHGFSRIERVYGPDIMNLEFSLSVQRNHKHFFYGGTPGVVEKLTRRLQTRFPGIQIVGGYCPPFRPLDDSEEADVVQRIDASNADIVWCGLGCPKQEKWMARLRPQLKAAVLIGVGAGFDFLAGEKPFAPDWIKRSGFEWAYRAWSEPKRLGPRYARVVPSFVYYAARSELGRVLSAARR